MSSRIVSKRQPDRSAPIAWTVWSQRETSGAESPPAAPADGKGTLATPEPAGDRELLRQLQEQVSTLQMELPRREQQARQTGYGEGEQAGRRAAAAELQPVLDRLARTIEELTMLRRRFRVEAERDVVKLALAIAKRVLYREINMDPDAMLGLVRVALEQIDLRELHRVRLHPADAPAVEQHLAAAGVPGRVEVIADPGLERGSAVFETARGNLDASVSTQLEEIGRGFGDLLERER